MKKTIFITDKCCEVELIKMNRASVTLSIEGKMVYCTRRVFNLVLNDSNSDGNFEIVDRQEKGLWLGVWEINIF